MKKDTKITNLSIESAGLPKDPKHAIAEYVWNGFDAGATAIDIDVDSNDLGYIHQISIRDNVAGIAYNLLEYSFGNFLDSVKKNNLKRSSYTRGKKGKGRFSFSLFATRAVWTTVVNEDNALNSYQIQIDRDSKEHYNISERTAVKNRDTGTDVKLQGIFGVHAAMLESEDFLDFMAQEFGWFLYLNRHANYSIRINGKALKYDHLIQETDQLTWTMYSPDDNDSYVFEVDYIRWNRQIGDRYYYYFLNSEKKEVAKLLSSFNNNAIGFHHSVYINSNFFDQFKQDDISLSMDENLFTGRAKQLVYRQVLAELREFLNRKQKKYVHENAVANQLDELERKGYLPIYNQTAADKRRKETLLKLIQEIYTAEPRIFYGVKSELVQSYLGFLDLVLQTHKRADVLKVIQNTVQLSEKENKRIRQILEEASIHTPQITS
ncbi:ATP-binding protein [Sphingobacterium thalpophilum]|uniref:ATP-binding protein n=1 Tax=Sphingobacterium thalpophilum TaxID=259 RepID=UPI0024A6BBCB|nr:ATP-binding protein [Sphingobacterium thalpophilum]